MSIRTGASISERTQIIHISGPVFVCVICFGVGVSVGFGVTALTTGAGVSFFTSVFGGTIVMPD